MNKLSEAEASLVKRGRSAQRRRAGRPHPSPGARSAAPEGRPLLCSGLSVRLRPCGCGMKTRLGAPVAAAVGEGPRKRLQCFLRCQVSPRKQCPRAKCKRTRNAWPRFLHSAQPGALLGDVPAGVPTRLLGGRRGTM